MTTTNRSGVLLAEVFRRESGRIVGSLIRRVGPARLDVVEDALQDALLAAMRAWPLSGVPTRPAAWLQRASRNALVDRLRRARYETTQDEIESLVEGPTDEASLVETNSSSEVFNDDLLRLLTYCCHPSLSQGAQVALTLRLACGLSSDEIATALFVTPESIAQRIVRAKRELREAAVVFELPEPQEFRTQRLAGVQQTIYLLFDAGYMSTTAAEPIRLALVQDALRLIELLLRYPPAHDPTTAALAALMYLTAARLPARRTADGKLVALEDQDRSRWDAQLIARGFDCFASSVTGEHLSRYHIEAAIAALHARAPSFASTDWPAIVRQYDLLLERFPSPAVAVSRAIAIRYADGPAQAWQAFEKLSAERGFESSVLYLAGRAELLHAMGDIAAAQQALAAAVEAAGNAHVKDLLRKRQRSWDSGDSLLSQR